MKRNSLITTFLVILFLLSAKFSKAQADYYYNMSFGLGAGANHSSTDVAKGSWGRTYSASIDYYFKPFLSLGLEGQYGLIRGGSIVNDPHNREFVNKYSNINLNAKVLLSSFIGDDGTIFKKLTKGLYAGLGVGLVNNKITDIVRYKPSWAAYDPNYGPFPGKDKSVDLFIPLNLGVDFYINDGEGYVKYAIGINAQSNITFGEGLDGYDDLSTKFNNKNPDTYNVYGLSLKYFFGGIKQSH